MRAYRVLSMAISDDVDPSRGDPNLTPVSPEDDARTLLASAASWGGVLAGVVAGLMTQLIRDLIGVCTGASTLNPRTDDDPTAGGFSVGAGIWWALSGIVAAFVGGHIASRLSGRPKASTGAWHGLTSWALTTPVVFYLLATAVGGLVGGAQVADAPEKVAQARARVALLGCLALNLGAMASRFGGRSGTVGQTVTAQVVRATVRDRNTALR